MHVYEEITQEVRFVAIRNGVQYAMDVADVVKLLNDNPGVRAEVVAALGPVTESELVDGLRMKIRAMEKNAEHQEQLLKEDRAERDELRERSGTLNAAIATWTNRAHALRCRTMFSSGKRCKLPAGHRGPCKVPTEGSCWLESADELPKEPPLDMGLTWNHCPICKSDNCPGQRGVALCPKYVEPHPPVQSAQEQIAFDFDKHFAADAEPPVPGRQMPTYGEVVVAFNQITTICGRSTWKDAAEVVRHVERLDAERITMHCTLTAAQTRCTALLEQTRKLEAQAANLRESNRDILEEFHHLKLELDAEKERIRRAIEWGKKQVAIICRAGHGDGFEVGDFDELLAILTGHAMPKVGEPRVEAPYFDGRWHRVGDGPLPQDRMQVIVAGPHLFTLGYYYDGDWMLMHGARPLRNTPVTHWHECPLHPDTHVAAVPNAMDPENPEQAAKQPTAASQPVKVPSITNPGVRAELNEMRGYAEITWKQAWRSIEKEPPPRNVYVAVCAVTLNGTSYDIARVADNGWIDSRLIPPITHWAPVPEPPEVKS